MGKPTIYIGENKAKNGLKDFFQEVKLPRPAHQNINETDNNARFDKMYK